MVRPTINSEKHLRAISLTTIDDNTAQSFVLIDAVVAPSVSSQVRVGAVVKAIHVELWYLSSSAQPTFHVSTIEKLVSGQIDPTSVQMSALHDYPNKKNIFKTSQGLVGDANSNPIPVFREWIPIPKGKQRFGLGDRLIITVAARGEAANDVEVCGMNIYKEYF